MASAGGPPAPRAPPRLSAADGVYLVDGRPTLLRCGEVQYFRVRRHLWAASLDRLRDAGFNAVASYIPWIWHEPEPGALDFTGASHPQRNLVAFLEACRATDLLFLARPGPFIYAEYRGFGQPLWLGGAIPDALARRSDGKPERTRDYQVFSLQHPAYLRQVERWYAAVEEALRAYLDDPVVAWQLDNETGLLFANSIGRLDFNPDTVARYRRFLERRYQVIERLNHRWRSPYRSFDHVRPPVPPFRFPELQDWQAFLEDWAAGYLRHLRDHVRSLGIAVPLAVNESATAPSPSSPAHKCDVADIFGYDSYAKSTGAASTTDFPFYTSQHPAIFRAYATETRPLTSLELGCGWWDPRARVPPEATLQALMGGLAHSLRGYNLYVVHEGADPLGAPYRFGSLIDEEGRPLPRLEVVQRAHEFAIRHEEELLSGQEVFDSIAYLRYDPYNRLDPREFLPGQRLVDPLQYFAWQAHMGLHALLLTCGYNPAVLDLQRTAEDDLRQYLVAILPTKGYLDVQSYGKLVLFALKGGFLVTLPVPATHDEDGWPLNTQFLYPQRPVRARWIGGGRMLWHLLVRWLFPYRMWARHYVAKALPTALHLSDLYEPVLVGQAAPLPGVALRSAGNGEVRGDYRLVEFSPALQSYGYAPGGAGRAREQPRRVEPVLWRGTTPVGYRAEARGGTSMVLGTLLAGSYVTSQYYALTAPARRALRRCALDLFEEVVPRRVVPDADLEVEAVLHRLAGAGEGCFLFLINRLGQQHGRIAIEQPTELGIAQPMRVEVLFAYKSSSASALRTNELSVWLAADDVLVLRLW